MNARALIVPETRQETVTFTLPTEPLETGLGPAKVTIGFRPDDEGKLWPQLWLHGETTINRVDYSWEIEFARGTDGHYYDVSRRLTRQFPSGTPNFDPPTDAASQQVLAELPGLCEAAEAWLDGHPDIVYQRRIENLQTHARALEWEANRMADELEEKLHELNGYQTEIARLEGRVQIESGTRKRPSPLTR